MAYDWRQDLPRLEQKYGLPAGLLGALVRAESGGNPGARSPAGAIGLTQLMPQTARGLGVNPNDPRQNLEGGAKYLAQQLRRFRSVPKALAAYNAGPGAVEQYGGVPPYKETQQYVKRLTGYWKESSRYGQYSGHTNNQMQQGGRVPGKSRAINLEVPDSLPTPNRQVTPGLSEQDQAGINIAFRKDPAMAQIIINNRMKQQNRLDEKYMGELTAYEARERQRQALINANQTQIQGPNTYKPGATYGTPTGGVATWNPSTRFTKANGKWVRNLGDGEDRYRFLQRIGNAYGLRNDPGNRQTFGGNHDPDGFHPIRRAVDFGDALNNRQQLMRFAEWARQNAGQIRELYYNPLGWGIKNGKIIQGLRVGGHDDHLHAAF